MFQKRLETFDQLMLQHKAHTETETRHVPSEAASGGAHIPNVVIYQRQKNCLCTKIVQLMNIFNHKCNLSKMTLFLTRFSSSACIFYILTKTGYIKTKRRLHY